MSSPSAGAPRFTYEQTVAHVRRVLHGFAPGYGDAQLSEQAYKIHVPASKLPLAILAREVMVVFGAEYRGKGDKVEWRYGFTVDGVPCMLDSSKWGLRLHIDAAVGHDHAAEQMERRVFDKLAAAGRIVSKSLAAQLKSQLAPAIEAGNVTITNQYVTLHGSYEYFREGAERAYAGSGRLADSVMWADILAGGGSQEGWWNTHAMVSSYFSMLEHVLIGCLPFTSFDPANGNLRSVIGHSWHEKMKELVNLNNAELPPQFAELRRIADHFRNTFSHGAFGHKGRAVAMSIELPDVGAVPVAFGEFGARPELLFVAGVKDDFENICAVFDSCDNWLANGPLADGYKWVLEGLDFFFDAQFRSNAADARNQGRFDEFLTAASAHMDDIINMDI